MQAFGAQGDGVTDDTSAIQAAIDEGEGTVYFPPGTYSTARLTPADGVRLLGAGSGLSVLTQRSGEQDVIFFDSLSASEASNLRNFRIQDLGIQGRSVEDGFSEQKHLVRISGVSGLRVAGCEFSAFQGDGIYVGSGASSLTERHNFDVVIEDTVFDGVNNANRNGVSIIDGTRVTIDGCTFTDCTSVGMPGGVDFEPNAVHNVLADLAVTDCDFVNIGGPQDLAFSIHFTQAAMTTPVNGLVIDGCSFTHADRALYLNQAQDADVSTPTQGLVVKNCTFANGGDFFYGGIAVADFSEGNTLGTSVFVQSPIADNFGVTLPA